MKTCLPTNGSIRRLAEEVSSFVDEVEAAYLLDRPRQSDDDRREIERMTVTMPLVVTPLDDQLRPTSYQHHAVTRDLSRKGVGFVTTSPVRLSYVLLSFQPHHGESMTIIGRVVYCHEVGYYFQVGCEFVLA